MQKTQMLHGGAGHFGGSLQLSLRLLSVDAVVRYDRYYTMPHQANMPSWCLAGPVSLGQHTTGDVTSNNLLKLYYGIL